ncbi:hypothetical protein [Paenarthrobacter sp. PH39-S1]|uniref:hypothetical protein n=1 Tax=Paenarthrobacter sp. PH39-S1 TaxID=3046204 RepID=UPI0024B8F075|nr:hypothetical protein [Paenarthrobacter sp. PH39-S1]MDJ0356017.1 hypothetical protein [Paenarthrobacter sp. PH39-S1]
MEGIEWKLFNSHGSAARIIAAEKVSEGGLGGFFARHFFEVTVEVDGAVVPAAAVRPARTGISALLKEADAADAAANGARFPTVSTASNGFAALLEDLTAAAPADGAPEVTDAPALVSGSGKVVMVVGLAADPMEITRSMGRVLKDAEIRTAGAIKSMGTEHVAGRIGLAAARAAGVAAGRTVIIAFGISPGGHVPSAALSEVDADQVWVAVDAARKPADTAVWVDRVGWAVKADALAVLGSTETLTPGTVLELGLPVGWIESGPATAADL